MPDEKIKETSPIATRIAKVSRRGAITVKINDMTFTAYEGETIAAVLLASGFRVFSNTDGNSQKSLYCGMGVCQQCLVSVNEEQNQRACTTAIQPGMRIETRPWFEVLATQTVVRSEADPGSSQ